MFVSLESGIWSQLPEVTHTSPGMFIVKFCGSRGKRLVAETSHGSLYALGPHPRHLGFLKMSFHSANETVLRTPQRIDKRQGKQQSLRAVSFQIEWFHLSLFRKL